MAKNSTAPALGAIGLARWAWRQLTSMRTALILLLVLAIVAIPGSIFPQRSVDSAAVTRYFMDHTKLAPVLDKLGFFEMYTSIWFGSVYVLLMVSLVGCIIPRTVTYARTLLARPPKAPRNLDRLDAYAAFETGADPERVLQSARRLLRGARTDIVDDELRAERGYLRELGNLVFHISLVLVLLGVAGGSLFGYRGTAMVIEGEAFSNILTQYDDFTAGALFDELDLPPFSFEVDDVLAEFMVEGESRGAPILFRADGRYRTGPDAAQKAFEIEVNHPLQIDGTQVALLGQGYAPVLKVTDATGAVVFNGAVAFLPEDATYVSSGVVKIPEAEPEQLGLQGFFLPTAVAESEDSPSISAFPGAANPYLALFAYHGDLGLDEGSPQSVFVLDKDELTQFKDDEGENFRIQLAPGDEQELPDGSIVEFVDLKQFARLQISSTPGLGFLLSAVVVGTAGLMLSLYVRPRRWWVRTKRDGSRTLVEVASLDKVTRADLVADLEGFAERLEATLGSDKE